MILLNDYELKISGGTNPEYDYFYKVGHEAGSWLSDRIREFIVIQDYLNDKISYL